MSIPCIIDDEWQGNCSFLYERLKITGHTWEVNILCNEKSILLEDNDTAENAVYIYSLRGIILLLTSGVVIYHHGPLAGRIPLLPFRRKCFHINHGIHYKKVELALNAPSRNRSKIKTKWFCKYHFVSSHIDALACCADYHVNLSDINITGIPRNDIFFSEGTAALSEKIRNDLDTIKKIAGKRKVIVYAPTWRNNGGAYQFSADEEIKLSEFLINNNAVFFYAGHPYIKERIVPSIDNVYDYNKICTDIQSILVMADCLVTDYSSVWIDFLLKNKPIISFQYDHDVYIDDRGFLFNVNNIFPGDVVYSFTKLLSVLEIRLAENTNANNKFKPALDIFHEYTDGKNCQRIIDCINKISSR